MASRAGSPNKNKDFLMKRLQDMYGDDFHPIMNMAKNCTVLQTIADDHAEGAITLGETTVGKTEIIDASISAKNANDAWEKIAQYLQPKLKAMEVTGPDGDPIDMKWVVEIPQMKSETD